MRFHSSFFIARMLVVVVGFLFLLLLPSRSVYDMCLIFFSFSSLWYIAVKYLFIFFPLCLFNIYLSFDACFWSYLARTRTLFVCLGIFGCLRSLACCFQVEILTSDSVLLGMLRWLECMSDRTCNNIAAHTHHRVANLLHLIDVVYCELCVNGVNWFDLFNMSQIKQCVQFVVQFRGIWAEIAFFCAKQTVPVHWSLFV